MVVYQDKLSAIIYYRLSLSLIIVLIYRLYDIASVIYFVITDKLSR